MDPAILLQAACISYSAQNCLASYDNSLMADHVFLLEPSIDPAILQQAPSTFIGVQSQSQSYLVQYNSQPCCCAAYHVFLLESSLDPAIEHLHFRCPQYIAHIHRTTSNSLLGRKSHVPAGAANGACLSSLHFYAKAPMR